MEPETFKNMDAVMSWVGVPDPYNLILSTTIKKIKAGWIGSIDRKISKYIDRAKILNISIDDAVNNFWPFKMINQFMIRSGVGTA